MYNCENLLLQYTSVRLSLTSDGDYKRLTLKHLYSHMAASCMQCNIFSVHCDLFCDLWDCISFVIQLVGWRADNWSSGLVDHHGELTTGLVD